VIRRGLVLIFALASLGRPAGAGAVGQIGYDGCLANDASQGCVDVNGTPMSGASGLAVSPDGGSVYVMGSSSDDLSHFLVTKPGGQLSFDYCLGIDASGFCTVQSGHALDGGEATAISPDGKSVYITSSSFDSVGHFKVDPTNGRLKYDGCLADDARFGCGDLPDTPLTTATGVAVSPDSRSLYVVSSSAGSISRFTLDFEGSMSYDGCLGNDTSHGCGDLPGTPLTNPISVAVSPDGNWVYVAAVGGNSISQFRVQKPGGQLVYRGCWASDASPGCVDLPNRPLDGAFGVAVGPDGKSVYVVSVGSSSISHFFVQNDQLAWDGCLANDGSQGCGDLPGAPLDGVHRVATSPDGNSVYATASGSGSILHFFVQKPGGQIVYDGCLANDASQGCGDLPGGPLTQADGVVVSPDGGSVYATGSDGVLHFFRAVDAAPPGGSVTTPGTPQPGLTTAARFLSARLSNRVFAVDRKGAPEQLVKSSAKRGTTFAYSLSGTGRVLFKIERAAAGRKVGRGCRKPSRGNRRAKPCTRYVKVGAFAQTAVAGANSKKWSGKLGRRGLKPGSYRATLVVSNPGIAATGPRRLRFTIVR
jgi:DNA-binding beta-propeller fold protein YncE